MSPSVGPGKWGCPGCSLRTWEEWKWAFRGNQEAPAGGQDPLGPQSATGTKEGRTHVRAGYQLLAHGKMCPRLLGSAPWPALPGTGQAHGPAPRAGCRGMLARPGLRPWGTDLGPLAAEPGAHR